MTSQGENESDSVVRGRGRRSKVGRGWFAAADIDVVTAFEANMVGKSDEEQLDYAVSQQRAIYTLNVSDFARLHSEHLRAGKEHFGIIVIPMQRYSAGAKIRRLAELVASRSSEEIRSSIVFL